MAGWCSLQCYDVLHILFGYMVVVNGTAHFGPSMALAQGPASSPRSCQSAHRGVRPIGGTISRFSCSCAATLLLGRGQQVRTDGARHRASALRRAFLPMHLASSSATGRSTGLCTSGCRRRPCSTCLTCFRLFWSDLQVSFVTTHRSMIDVADLSMFRLL